MKTYIEGDIHEVIKTLEDNSIDFIYTDPPFGITSAEWDTGLNWEELFPQMWRVLKPRGIICLYASMPFTYELLKYQTPKYQRPKYHYTWRKNNSTGFLAARFQPLRDTEEIFVYYKKAGTYNPQMVGTEFHPKRKVKVGSDKHQYWGVRKNLKDKDLAGKKSHMVPDEGHTGRYPKTLKEWKIRKGKTGITRGDDQIDFFIKTYTNEGDTILDMTCHNQTVGDRCDALVRDYIGIDLKI